MTPMQSRCLPAITRLLEEGRRLDKNDAAELAHCDPKTAQRILTHLWLEGYTRIVSWRREHGSPIPAYLWGPGKDVKRPEPYTGAQRAARRRKDPQTRNKINAEKRNARRLKNPPKLGLWNL